jgi:uncharacterized membrane protein
MVGRLQERHVARIATGILWSLIVLYVAYFGTMTVRKHNAFQTTAYDLGNVDQAVWNTRHGRPLAMTNIEGLTNRLGTHVEPILLPISLLYFVWSDPRALLILQTVVIALGAWPVYLLAQRVLSNGKASSKDSQAAPYLSHYVLPLIFALVYLLFPALQSANTFDFHAVSLAPTFFLFALYFLETEHWGGYALFVLLTMSCKEDMPLLVCMLGLYALVVRRRWRIGLATVAVAIIWFLVAVGVIMPAFDPRGVSPLANRYSYLGDDPLEMAVTFIAQPGVWLSRLFSAESLTYIGDLLVPVAFLSLLAPQVLVLALPPLFVNLLSTEGYMHELEGFHYGVILVPTLVVSAAYGTAWLVQRRSRLRYLLVAVVLLACTLLYHYFHGYTPLAAGFEENWPLVTNHHLLGQDIGRSIPTEASLAVLPYPNPHASQRQQLHMINRIENGLPAPLYDADYVWLDATDGWPLHPNDLKASVESLLEDGYGLEQATDGWLLLGRGTPNKDLPEKFYDFARSANPEPQYPMHLQFYLDGEPLLESLGFDHSLDSTGSSLRFYWRALAPLPPGLRLYPFYFEDSTGQILEDTTLRPMVATVWYPPEDWKPGEVVVTSTLPWPVGPDYSVGLGVELGNDWQNPGQRLPITVESSDLVIRLFEGDTWVRLLHVSEGEPIEEYRTFASPSPEHPFDADFDGQIRLLGYDLTLDSNSSAADIRLYWQAQTRLDTSYTVFAQLLDQAGSVRAQADSVPQDGGYPTVWWLPGEIVAHDVALEFPSVPTQGAEYRLIVGLYDPTSGDRLAVTGTGADFVELRALTP